ncbi:unnamed protein product [Ectocarpus sp. CCAP 1310/34]|nr:unnamed protein product [Ectocarpus sp. CCAP 1310/34]
MPARGRLADSKVLLERSVRFIQGGFTDLVWGNRLKPPEYGRTFSRASSLRFFTQYNEYERSMGLCNSGQSIKRPLLNECQLLRQSIHKCLSRTYFDGTELEETDLCEALAKHAECWTDDTIEPSIAAAAVTRMVAMGTKATAVDRIDAVRSRLEREYPSAERNSAGAFKNGSAAVMSKAVVAESAPPEFKVEVESKLDMQGSWKDNPELVFEIARDVAVEWRTVELADRQRGQSRGGGVQARKKNISATEMEENERAWWRWRCRCVFICQACYEFQVDGLFLLVNPRARKLRRLSSRQTRRRQLPLPSASFAASTEGVGVPPGPEGPCVPAFRGVQPGGRRGHTKPGELKVADGRRVLEVIQKTCPVRIALHTSWGLVSVDPFSLAVMTGNDEVVILGNPTLKALGIDVYESLGTCSRSRASVMGVQTTAWKECRRVTLAVDALQRSEGREQVEQDPAVKRLVAQRPHADMSPEEEASARSASLDSAVSSAVVAGLDEPHVGRLRSIIRERWNAFRPGMRPGDPPANVEPLRVTLKPGALPVKARPRTYNPIKTAWLAGCMASPVVLGLVFLNMQAVSASAAMATPKKGGYRLLSDFRAANNQVEKVPGVMPNPEASMAQFSATKFHGSLDLLRAYCQRPLSPEAQKIFTIATPRGLHTPKRVPQGILNATSYFQATLSRILEGLNCLVWVDGVVNRGMEEDDLLNTLDMIVERLDGAGLTWPPTNARFLRPASHGAGRCTPRARLSMIPSG